MESAAISIRNLSKEYPGTHAVRGIDLEVFQGEFFGLLGPNGAGKTTTISILTGLTEPTSGSVLINGRSITSSPIEVKSALGFVPQEFAFYHALSAMDNLRFFGRLYGLKGPRLEARIRDALEIASLKDKARKVVGEFSNGMKRRLNIAIGLLHEPRLLILDEPTVGVDAHNRHALYTTLETLNTHGMTVLLTTHRMEEAQRLCHRVAIMDQGRIITTDTPAALIRRYGEGLVRAEFRAPVGKSLEERMKSLESVQALEGRDRQWTLTTLEPEKTVRALMALKETADVGVRSLNILEPNLESVFIHLTGRRIENRTQI